MKRVKALLSQTAGSNQPISFEKTRTMTAGLPSQPHHRPKSVSKTMSNGFRARPLHSASSSRRSRSRSASPQVVFRIGDVNELGHIRDNLPNLRKAELVSLSGKLCGYLERLGEQMGLLNERLAASRRQKVRPSDDAEASKYRRKAQYYKSIVEGLRLKLERKRAKIEKMKGMGVWMGRGEQTEAPAEPPNFRRTASGLQKELDGQTIQMAEREGRLQVERIRMLENDLRAKTLEADSRTQLLAERDGQVTQLREEVRRLRAALESERLNSLGNQDKSKVISELRDRNTELEVT